MFTDCGALAVPGRAVILGAASDRGHLVSGAKKEEKKEKRH